MKFTIKFGDFRYVSWERNDEFTSKLFKVFFFDKFDCTLHETSGSSLLTWNQWTFCHMCHAFNWHLKFALEISFPFKNQKLQIKISSWMAHQECSSYFKYYPTQWTSKLFLIFVKLFFFLEKKPNPNFKKHFNHWKLLHIEWLLKW